jgi:hypothetical protein
MNKETKSFHGDYSPKDMAARIGNLSRPPVNIIITSLHEAAHHCEYCMSGNTGHQKSFYIIYYQLMTTAIKMGLFTYEMAKTVTDSSSIRQLERHCGPITVNAQPEMQYMKDYVLFYVFDSYNFKGLLHINGYFFNSRAKAWEKIVPKARIKEEKYFLDNLPSNVSVFITDDMLDLTIIATITVTGNTYEKKEILSSLNFIYKKTLPGKKTNGWYKRIKSTELPEYRNAIKILESTTGITVDVEY